ncbi:MAG: hypothetical protein ACYC4L_18840 [Chloroflexota bacterium]
MLRQVLFATLLALLLAQLSACSAAAPVGGPAANSAPSQGARAMPAPIDPSALPQTLKSLPVPQGYTLQSAHRLPGTNRYWATWAGRGEIVDAYEWLLQALPAKGWQVKESSIPSRDEYAEMICMLETTQSAVLLGVEVVESEGTTYIIADHGQVK